MLYSKNRQLYDGSHSKVNDINKVTISKNERTNFVRYITAVFEGSLCNQKIWFNGKFLRCSCDNIIVKYSIAYSYYILYTNAGGLESIDRSSTYLWYSDWFLSCVFEPDTNHSHLVMCQENQTVTVQADQHYATWLV